MCRMIVDTRLDGIGICPLPDLRFVYVNEAYAKMTGIPRAELIGHAIPEFKFGPDEAEYEELRASLEHAGFIRDVVVPLESRTGTRVTLLVSAVIAEQEGERRAIWMLRDITELKRTVASLRAEVAERTVTEQRLRESEAMDAPLPVRNPEVVTQHNHRVAEVLAGHRPGDLAVGELPARRRAELGGDLLPAAVPDLPPLRG